MFRDQLFPIRPGTVIIVDLTVVLAVPIPTTTFIEFRRVIELILWSD